MLQLSVRNLEVWAFELPTTQTMHLVLLQTWRIRPNVSFAVKTYKKCSRKVQCTGSRVTCESLVSCSMSHTGHWSSKWTNVSYGTVKTKLPRKKNMSKQAVYRQLYRQRLCTYNAMRINGIHLLNNEQCLSFTTKGPFIAMQLNSTRRRVASL